jgi:arylsulfatase A-like enzyme
MPARRELHTGRYNFLHRSWGPLEPFDDSMPEVLKDNGVYTHLVSDHYHYWEDGGCTYHTKYSSWEIVRGQEGDPWKSYLKVPGIPDPNPQRDGVAPRRDWTNREYIEEEKDFPQANTFRLGLDFIEKNKDLDSWFLQLETFDPHEPYYVPEKYKKLYDFDYSRITNDWPSYARTEGRDELSEHYCYLNAALISMCDEYLGKVLDMMDKYDMWQDTMLIVNTDHGFLLGEHNWWAKCAMPFYNEIAHAPLFVWDPRCGVQGERRESLVQTIDLAPTLLEFFGQQVPEDMEGKPLKDTICRDAKIRDAALFGLFGGHVNCTDGRYVYMRSPASKEANLIYQYTHMPAHMRKMFSVEEMRTMEAAPPFSFTKECPVMKIESDSFQGVRAYEFGNLLFDLKNDPDELNPLTDSEIECMMTEHMVKLMEANDAPAEQFQRLGLKK